MSIRKKKGAASGEWTCGQGLRSATVQAGQLLAMIKEGSGTESCGDGLTSQTEN